MDSGGSFEPEYWNMHWLLRHHHVGKVEWYPFAEFVPLLHRVKILCLMQAACVRHPYPQGASGARLQLVRLLRQPALYYFRRGYLLKRHKAGCGGQRGGVWSVRPLQPAPGSALDL